jgi:hypothetical protein
MGVKLVSASAGSVEIVAPTTASNYTATMPAKTGNVMLDGPAFSAYANATQSISQATFTKVAINTKIFDTASAFDATTNYRFQPLIAGYYQVNGTVRLGGTTGAELIIALYKTGAVYSRGGDIAIASLGTCQLTFNEVVSLNGSTDYIELYGYVNAASGQQLAYISADITSRFSASLVRGA